ncbi:histone deacetylase 6 isoform X2 [Dendroctonus ponderosae]|uniref:histone deacetylase 6 isoform X2 n=1 Tax=Dendroctonus ponderosae TaxID=77166 RepID=UPI0020350EF6|nr:histone deacetylase 6 isoform X2 [Dendroctonus ponderosae]
MGDNEPKSPETRISPKPISRKSLRELIQEKRQEAKKDIREPSFVDDPYGNTSDFKGVFRKETAYCFVPSDEHYSLWDAKHPENPQRSHAVHQAVEAVYNRLQDLTDKTTDIDAKCLLSLVHTPEYILEIEHLCSQESESQATQYDSIYYNGLLSNKAAINAAKNTLNMAKMVAEGKVQNGFANVRPPGHHATPHVPNGFCLYNNIAITAKYLLENKLTERILIVDYDVHHGQGTQRIFYETDQVLYFSIHRYEYGKFWPNLEESSFNHVGSGKGTGYNINVPLNQTGLTDYDYLSIILNVLLPVAYEYNPDLVLVSSGFDSCTGDFKGEMNITPAFYAHLIHMLGGLAGGKMLVVLEGGYFLPSLAEGALQTVKALLNDPSPPLEYHKNINSSVIDSINNVKVALRPYWKCFNQVDPISPITDIVRFDRFNYHVAVHRYFGVVPEPPFPTSGGNPLNSESLFSMHDSKVVYLRGKYNSLQNIVGYMENIHSAGHEPGPGLRIQEVQKRVQDIISKFIEYELLKELKPVEFHHDRSYPSVVEDVERFLQLTHSADYLEMLWSSGPKPQPDLYWDTKSRKACRFSCAVLCQLALEIKRSSIAHGVGIVRPPGHHAKSNSGGGFCLVNNVAVSANYAIDCLGYKKVLIIDFDVHHGDGTQELTYSKDNVMYISLHRFDGGKFFPKDPAGNYMYVGEEKSAGYNLNVAFENAKMSDADYLYTWIKIVLPLAYSFNPDIIFVSAGFDAGIHDPLGHYNVHPETFGHLIQLVKSVAPVILALEGGYNHTTTSLGMVNCVKALLGHPLPFPTIGDVKREAALAMAQSISAIKQYWPIMEVNKKLDPVIRSQSDFDDATKQMSKIAITL